MPSVTKYSRITKISISNNEFIEKISYERRVDESVDNFEPILDYISNIGRNRIQAIKG